MKKILWFVLFLAFTACLPVYASPNTFSREDGDFRLPSDVDLERVDIEDVLATPSVDPNAKIYDFADLLTDAEETKVYIQLNEFILKTGINAIIVTTNDISHFSLREYTYHFYDYNDFADVGVSFVIYMNGDSPSISIVNNGASNSEVYEAYTDSRVQEMLKHIYNTHIKEQDYLGACEKFVLLIDGFYDKTFGASKLLPSSKEDSSFPWVEVFIISGALSFIVIVLVISKYQKPVVRVDQLVKKSVNNMTMTVKCEYDKPLGSKENDNS